MNDKMLIAKDVCKKYAHSKTYANKDIDISINTGEIKGLFGPNGAGKTTFVRQVCGLLKPDSGYIEIDGVDISKHKNYIPSKVSYLGQIAYTHRALKVIEFIQFTGVYRGIDAKESKRQALKLLEYFGMIYLQDKLIGSISGGETRLVAFMAAIIGYNPFVVLDEPTNDVDPEKRILLWQLVKKLKEERGISFLLVTHNIQEASNVVDDVAIMYGGQIIKQGRPYELAEALKIGTKVDFVVPYHTKIDDELISRLKIIKIDDEHLRINVSKDKVNTILNELYSSSLGSLISSIKILPPSLEDIYMMNIKENK